ncbi:MAG TPA: threonine synthase [Candidatus Dormibacteraeota bacterium]|jgi:threonine synthase|nr:threonine synthase [Candidatus Dormibacteraeota bacterium]
MTAVRSLMCRECQTEFPVTATHVCEMCFGPLEVRYDHGRLAETVTRESIQAGPNSVWRYRDLLPLPDGAEPVTLGEGMTPLVHARTLGAALGLDNLWLKNDTMNPTNSFKDRVVSVAVSWARANGFDTMACASTGNLANSVAAYSARAGMRCFVFIPADLEASKVLTTSVFAPNVVAVEGNYDEVNRLCSELADTYHWAFANINVRPFYAEGSKTLTYETAEQLGWRLPDEIVIPIASGCQFVKHNKAIQELIELELVEPGPYPRLTGAQATNCSPVATAFKEGQPVRPVRPDTIAKSLAIGNPSDGKYVINIAGGTGGVVESVSEAEIVAAIELLARTEGIFAETAGGVTVGTLAKLARAGRWRGHETVVAYITGHGFKTIQVLEDLERHRRTIKPSYRAFQETYADLL